MYKLSKLVSNKKANNKILAAKTTFLFLSGLLLNCLK